MENINVETISNEMENPLAGRWDVRVVKTKIDRTYLVKMRWQKCLGGEKYYKAGCFKEKKNKVFEELGNIGIIKASEYQKIIPYIDYLIENDIVEIVVGNTSDYIEDEESMELALMVYSEVLKYVEKNRTLFPNRSDNNFNEKEHWGVVSNGQGKSMQYWIRSEYIKRVLEEVVGRGILKECKKVWKVLGNNKGLMESDSGRYGKKVKLRDDIKEGEREYVYVFNVEEGQENE